MTETADTGAKRLLARRGGELEALLLYIELVGLTKKGKWGHFVASTSRRVDLLPDLIRAAGRASGTVRDQANEPRFLIVGWTKALRSHEEEDAPLPFGQVKPEWFPLA